MILKKLFFLFVMIIFSTSAKSQLDTFLYQPNYVITSFTYIFQGYNTDEINYNEYTYRLEYARRISRKFILGVDGRYIWDEYKPTNRKDSYWIAGIFSRFIIEPNLKKQFYVEGTFHTGNFCVCGEGDKPPSKESGIIYLGFGAGMNWKLYQGIYLQLAFMNYQTVKPIQNSYAYTQYIIGLGYNF